MTNKDAQLRNVGGDRGGDSGRQRINVPEYALLSERTVTAPTEKSRPKVKRQWNILIGAETLGVYQWECYNLQRKGAPTAHKYTIGEVQEPELSTNPDAKLSIGGSRCQWNREKEFIGGCAMNAQGYELYLLKMRYDHPRKDTFPTDKHRCSVEKLILRML